MLRAGGIDYKTVLVFGDKEDRVIETVGKTRENHTFELGYYNGSTKPKAIINISPAVGCPVGCNFCELTDIGQPLSVEEMTSQVAFMVAVARDIDGLDLASQPLKINVAKTGEPVLNPNIPEAFGRLRDDFPGISFKYSTSMLDAPFLIERIKALAVFAAGYKEGSVQLTISLISANENYRLKSAKARLASFKRIREAVDTWHEYNPSGRMPNCSLLVGADTPCDPKEVMEILPSNLVKFRIRKIVSTEHSLLSGIHEVTDRRVRDILRQFRDCGYEMSDAGMPTHTEAKHGLASNVTRHRMAKGEFPEGVFHVPDDYPREPLVRHAGWVEGMILG